MPQTTAPAPTRPQVRFLLRGSLLLVTMLALWWWVLLDPLLGLLRVSADLALRCYPGMGWRQHIALDAAGNWNMEVPLPERVWRQPQVQALFGAAAAGRPVRVPRIRFAPESIMPVRFALAFPLYWAILLAAPRGRRTWQAAIAGTVLIWLIAVGSLFLYAANTIGSQLHVIANDFPGYLLTAGEYLNLNVVPYIAPLLIALALHRELRVMVLSLEA
jgi:hypothetical protein